MPDVYQLARDQRAALAAGDTAALRKLTSIYRRDVLKPLEAELAAFYRKVDRLRARGVQPSPAWPYQEGRLNALIADARRRMAAFSEAATATTTATAQAAYARGVRGGAAMVDAATPATLVTSFAGPRPDAIEAVAAQVEAATSGMRRLTDQQSRVIEQRIVGALAAGKHPRELARVLRDDASLPLTRALTIARTEQLRAYRTGAHLTYREADDVLEGWVWLSAADSRTCAACWSMHGSFHPTDEEMGAHPNCRCVSVPRSRPWSEIGGDDDLAPQMPTPGEQLFRNLSERDQQRVLGPTAFREYRRGDLLLEDLLGKARHPIYGESPRRVPLRTARLNASVRKSGAGGNPILRTVPGRNPEILPRGLTR